MGIGAGKRSAFVLGLNGLADLEAMFSLVPDRLFDSAIVDVLAVAGGPAGLAVVRLDHRDGTINRKTATHVTVIAFVPSSQLRPEMFRRRNEGTKE